MWDSLGGGSSSVLCQGTQGAGGTHGWGGTECLGHCLDAPALREDPLGDVELLSLEEVSAWRGQTQAGVGTDHPTSNPTRVSSSSLPSCCWQPSRLVLLLLSQFLMAAE